MKVIKFDRHARRRMKWRKISEEEVISVLTQPDNKESTSNNRMNAYKKINGEIIKVTFNETKEEIYVITAVIKK